MDVFCDLLGRNAIDFPATTSQLTRSVLDEPVGGADSRAVQYRRIGVVVQVGDENVTRRILHLDTSDDHFHHAAFRQAAALVQGIEVAPVFQETRR